MNALNNMNFNTKLGNLAMGRDKRNVENTVNASAYKSYITTGTNKS